MYLLLVNSENWLTLQNISKIWTKCEKYIIFILNMPISIIKIEIHMHSKDLSFHSNKMIKLSKKSSRYMGHRLLLHVLPSDKHRYKGREWIANEKKMTRKKGIQSESKTRILQLLETFLYFLFIE